MPWYYWLLIGFELIKAIVLFWAINGIMGCNKRIAKTDKELMEALVDLYSKS